jgi:chalcone isomerase
LRYAGEFEKFTRVTMILPLTGAQYSEKVTENCVAYWKAVGKYTDAEAAAVDKFKEAFKAESFPPGASILFTHSPAGVLTVAFSKDSSVPESGGVAIENRPLCEAVLESIIGEHGVSPAAKLSLATRVAELLKEQGAEDVVLVVGGTIPHDDIPQLKELGVAEVFTPGSPTQEIVDFLRSNVSVD